MDEAEFGKVAWWFDEDLYRQSGALACGPVAVRASRRCGATVGGRWRSVGV